MARHVIVDGSNIATEGRAMPSLRQLNEAVTAFMQEFPDDVITVVVDATFGHRIDPSEVAEFDEAVAHNELVAPPAGAIGRGDSFILSIANKTKGSILTNDSYQEFHGEYPWVFDEGRLIGGKPVPNVGWVFVLRTPVRGPVSRKSVRAGRSVDKNTGRVPRASKEASQPMPVPKAPPPGVTIGKGGRSETATPAAADGRKVPTAASDGGRRRGRRDGRNAAEGARVEMAPVPAADVAAPRPAPARDEPVNELMAFINFVEHHPVGSSVNAVVESYSSHGAYVAVGNVRGYVPLRLMSEPPARSARELGKVGDAVTLVVHSFTPARRSIDMAVPAAAIKDGITPASVPVEPHAAETAAIAEAAVIATADTVAVSPVATAKPGRRPRKAAATVAAPAGVSDGAAASPVAEPPVAAARSTARSKRAAPTASAAGAAPETPVAPTTATASTPGARSKRVAKSAAAPATEPAAPPAVPAKRTSKKAATPPSTGAGAAAAATSAAKMKPAGARVSGGQEPADAVATSAKRAKKAPPKAVGTSPSKKAPAKAAAKPAKATEKKAAKAVGERAAKPTPAKPATASPAKPASAKRAAATTAASKKAPAKKAPATRR